MDEKLNSEILSPIKKALMAMSDDQLTELVRLAKTAENGTSVRKRQTEGLYFPQNVQERVRELQRMKGMPGFREDPDDNRWLRYISALSSLDTSVPCDAGVDDRTLYRQVLQACREKHLPETFAAEVVPSIVTYMKTGYMKPIVFSGPPGCGKTATAGMLAQIMNLPFSLISAPRAEMGHGFQGEARMYRGGDLGEFARSILHSGTLHGLFFIDELDKAAQNPSNRSNQQDELLNILADMRVSDNYLEMDIPLQHSPVIIAVNDLESLSRPFLDRCTVIPFREVEPERLAGILHEYAADCVKQQYTDRVKLETRLLDNASDRLYRSGITSIRQHQRLVEFGLKSAYHRYLESDTDVPVSVSDADFASALEKLSGKPAVRRIGF